MIINIQGVGFYEDNAVISCQIANDTIKGHLDIEITQVEYKEALVNDTLVELATRYIQDIAGEASEVQQVKIDELQKEIESLKEDRNKKDKEQAEANLTLMTMIAMLESEKNETVNK